MPRRTFAELSRDRFVIAMGAVQGVVLVAGTWFGLELGAGWIASVAMALLLSSLVNYLGAKATGWLR